LLWFWCVVGVGFWRVLLSKLSRRKKSVPSRATQRDRLKVLALPTSATASVSPIEKSPTSTYPRTEVGRDRGIP